MQAHSFILALEHAVALEPITAAYTILQQLTFDTYQAGSASVVSGCVAGIS